MGCIYGILNVVNWKIYIGQTINFRHRTSTHICESINGVHENKHFKRAVKKYGIENFMFFILENVEDLSLLTIKEDYYIQMYQSNDENFGYNKRVAADSNKGIKFGPQSEEHIAKRTKTMLATRLKNDSTVKGDKHHYYGKFYTLDERIKMSKSGFPGAKFDKRRNTWSSRIYINDKETYLGSSYNTKEEAFEAYKEKYYELEQQYLKSKLGKEE